MNKKRDFLSIWDLSKNEIENLIKRAIDLKSGADKNKCPLIGKSIGLFFEKPSTRTRVSFEVGIYQLGGQSIYLNPKEIQLGRGESIADTARVLSRYLNGIVLRTFSHSSIEEFAAHAAVPVINGLSDLHHPCQALADIMTIIEKKGRLKGIRLAYIGDGNNVANSLIEAAALTGMNIAIACPEGYEPDPDVLDRARGSKDVGDIIILRNPKEAAGMADVIYTDVWISMGQEEEAEKKKSKFRNYQINSQLLQCAKKDVIILHCLPAHRGEEITDEVMDSPNSAVFDQAENRLHTEKALLEFLIR
ncbi:ornithine carbamoyltransferase, catabolic [Dissulfurispira thermophila]|uniref:Ornithine carbamoyltransferase n=1 Tax=Dissulfurispira thermophila TaxID=2715679 RepID=A0A7G1GYV6_9BACT|nr:ornithine carbamoyltransferase [Dissulfurispira thermophila]BCB95645.1 ornithine carbamoyltransferase, catabolic [Dissulfurispira thermophila]